jgi:NAD(P)-dependent dehydrogenase (short-subunit alcohol dehydrogenase family)
VTVELVDFRARQRYRRNPFNETRSNKIHVSILITGASKGIGRGTAADLARRGHRVVATARDPRTRDDLDVDQRLRLDVTDHASLDAATAQAGEIDVLMSNAGGIFAAAIEASPIAEIERLFAAGRGACFSVRALASGGADHSARFGRDAAAGLVGRRQRQPPSCASLSRRAKARTDGTAQVSVVGRSGARALVAELRPRRPPAAPSVH